MSFRLMPPDEPVSEPRSLGYVHKVYPEALRSLWREHQNGISTPSGELHVDYIIPPGSSVHELLQARILKWLAIPFSRGPAPNQGSNPGLLHCRQIPYRLSHPKLLSTFELLSGVVKDANSLLFLLATHLKHWTALKLNLKST